MVQAVHPLPAGLARRQGARDLASSSSIPTNQRTSKGKKKELARRPTTTELTTAPALWFCTTWCTLSVHFSLVLRCDGLVYRFACSHSRLIRLHSRLGDSIDRIGCLDLFERAGSLSASGGVSVDPSTETSHLQDGKELV